MSEEDQERQPPSAPDQLLERDVGIRAQIASVLDGLGLRAPPIPEGMASSVSHQGKWTWSTSDVVRRDLYLFHPVLATISEWQAPNFTLSYGGQGVNSYAWSLHVVATTGAIYVQELWGGVYDSPALGTKRVNDMFATVGVCCDLIANLAMERKFYVLASSFREVCFLGWEEELAENLHRSSLHDDLRKGRLLDWTSLAAEVQRIVTTS